MDCNQAENNIIDYLYDELSSSDQQAFEQHIEKCPMHAKEVDRLRATLTFVRKQPKADIPLECSNRILAQAEIRTTCKARPLRILLNPVAAFAVVAGVILTVGVVTVRDWRPAQERILVREEAALEHRLSVPVSTDEKEANKVVLEDKVADAGEVIVDQPVKPKKPVVRSAKRKPKLRPTAQAPTKKQKYSGISGSGAAKLIGTKKAKPKLEEYEPPKDISSDYLESSSVQTKSAAVQKSRPMAQGNDFKRPKRVVAGKYQSIDLFEKAELYMAKKNTAQAVIWYRRFLKANPSDNRAGLARYRLAKALFLLKRCKQAIFAVEKAVKKTPQHPLAGQALLDQASCLARENRFQEAARLYRRVAKEYPDQKADAEQALGLIRSTLSPASEVKSNKKQ